MRDSIAEALSNYEVAEKIWSLPANQICADCDAAKPEWAAINLCVVFCKRCAGNKLVKTAIYQTDELRFRSVSVTGEHRGLGPSISKVRSLKMDKKVWTEDLIQVCSVTLP